MGADAWAVSRKHKKGNRVALLNVQFLRLHRQLRRMLEVARTALRTTARSGRSRCGFASSSLVFRRSASCDVAIVSPFFLALRHLFVVRRAMTGTMASSKRLDWQHDCCHPNEGFQPDSGQTDHVVPFLKLIATVHIFVIVVYL